MIHRELTPAAELALRAKFAELLGLADLEVRRLAGATPVAIALDAARDQLLVLVGEMQDAGEPVGAASLLRLRSELPEMSVVKEALEGVERAKRNTSCPAVDAALLALDGLKKALEGETNEKVFDRDEEAVAQ